ncbi:DUF305 domain-containing protein [uncultured Arthrobacter sp.]|uniref:DUF305 domain-containing protein n=1 Tax=uncultured Arthrobacter sp. TaxID=114050 RepID=UPI0026283730|nr:DUF305 domain-containing protein [uncultured Arthrobacter sp.]
MKRYLSLAALSVAAVVALAGCGGDTDTGAPVSDAPASAGATPSEGSAGNSSPSSSVSEEHNEADVMFAQMMIPHHQQAVEMSDVMLAKEDVSAEVTDLATRIKEAQAPEIETMTGWLEAWGEPVAVESMEGHDMGSMGGGMDGMMSEDQMAELEAAEGEEAARMFLESMTAHHNGAVAMAQEEIENGENPDAIALAEAIVEAQEAEIEEMEQLLGEL